MKKRKTKVEKLGATTKRAKRIRTAAEFPLLRLVGEMRYPLRPVGNFAWDIDAIKGARDDQLRGHFRSAAHLAQAMSADAGLFTARLNRLAPMRGLPIELRAADDTARALRVRDEGEALFGRKGIALQRDSLMTLHKQFVDHGVAFGYNVWTPREDGSRVDVELRAWPIEYVRWLPQARAFFTMTKQGELMKIEHGDGRWVVFQQEKLDPWTDGCIVAGALIWADRAFGIRDRSNSSKSHGTIKMVGEMPDGVSLETTDANGNATPTPEAQAMLDLLETMHLGDTPFGVRPAGAKTELLVNTSQAWQIWNEIIKTNDADSARIYLGQDGTTTNTGGNYIKSERLFGVRNDLVEADVETFAESILTGTIEPWSAINFGDSRFAPARMWLMPDADEDARRTSIGEHQGLFFRDLNAMLQMGFTVDQTIVNRLAATYGVTAPIVPASGLKAVDTLPTAPTATAASNRAVVMKWRAVEPKSRRRAA